MFNVEYSITRSSELIFAFMHLRIVAKGFREERIEGLN